LQKWKFENEFLLNLDGNLNTVEGKGYALGNVYLSEIETNLDALKIEGRISLIKGNLPNQIPKIYLIATDGMDKEIASTTIPFNLISYSQIEKKVYSFSLSLLNPPKPINGGHYEVYLELGNNPFLINTTSKISKYYFPLIYFPEKKVLIYEVYYDVATGTDPDNEWVIIHNLENETIDISNWKICDNVECDEIPTSSIPANGFAIVTASSTTFDLWKIPKGMTKIVLEDKRIGNGLANSGDRVILKDRYGNIVDTMSYGDETFIFFPTCTKKLKATEGKSLLRDPRYKDTNTCEDFIESEPTIGKNRPPIPIINYFPKNPVKGIKVKFDASLSDDPDGEIKEFFWEIKKGEKILATSTATITNFVFSENGDYQITLTATDNEGATSSASTTIRVQPFSFAIITDLHIGRGYPDYDSSGFEDSGEGEDYYLTERLKNVVQWIIDNRDNIQCENATCSIKFLAVLGDIADSGEKSEFLKAKKILGRLNEYGIPYVPLFGNHDVWPYTDFDEATTSLGENYFDEIFWDENATNTKLMKEILNWQRDKSNPKYKNFAFDFGGINFLGLDFNSREKFMKFGKGVGADAVLNEISKKWLEEKLKEFGEKSMILFAHHPFTTKDGRIYAFTSEEISELEKIMKNKKILFDFGGHIHSFEEIHGKLAPANANIKYDPIGSTNVLTTEALMVGSNGRGVEKATKENGVVDGKKGILRIVKVFDEKNINPNNWETTEKGDEFLAFNPILNFGFSLKRVANFPCIEVEADSFTEKPFAIEWNFGDGTSASAKEYTKCYEKEGKYKITLTLKHTNSDFKEEISKEVEVKEGVIPRTIKRTKEQVEKGIEFISQSAKMSFDKIGQTVKDKVRILKKKSPGIPIGEITVHFENLSDDIQFSNLVADTDFEKQKTILYMENWLSEEKIERLKILFLSKK
jgi:PKD repeat protein